MTQQRTAWLHRDRFTGTRGNMYLQRVVMPPDQCLKLVSQVKLQDWNDWLQDSDLASLALLDAARKSLWYELSLLVNDSLQHDIGFVSTW
jgi:hypothetical protein